VLYRTQEGEHGVHAHSHGLQPEEGSEDDRDIGRDVFKEREKNKKKIIKTVYDNNPTLNT